MPGADMPMAVLPVKPDVMGAESKNMKTISTPLVNGVNEHTDRKENIDEMKIDSMGALLRFDIFTSSKEISAKNSLKHNTIISKETKDITSKFKGISSDLDIYTTQISAFMKTRKVLFLSPTESLKSNAQFKTLYSSVVSEELKKASHHQRPLIKVPSSLPNNSVKETKIGPDGLEVLSVVKPKSNLLPVEEFKRKELIPGMKVYVMKQSQVGEFGIGTILTIREADPERLFKIRLDNSKATSLKLFTAKQLAYTTTSDAVVPVGTRICARYWDDQSQSSIFAGIVAEPPKVTNKERYLIFFDDGYAQYIYHQDIFVMCAQSNDVADDIHENLKEFIKAYLQKYPERPMVKLQKNQITRTEYECKWWDTKVLEIDASMVRMHFMESGRSEWIYRGSTRLKLLFDELQNAEEHRRAGKNRRHNIVPRKPHQPYVEYTREEEIVTLDSGDSDEEPTSNAQYHHPRRKTGGSQYTEKPRNTARKSGSGQPKPKQYRSAICNAPLKYRAPDIKSHLGYKDFHVLCTFIRVTYETHACSRLCKEKKNPALLKGNNPFLIPIQLSWERQVRKITRRKRFVKFKIAYRAPCGRQLRNMQEIQMYLIMTRSQIPVDFFSVDTHLNIFRTFRAKEILFEIKDVTQGKENVPVACVNSWSNEPPPYIDYEPQRFPGKNVNLNLDPEFLAGCSCVDNCQDVSKCGCLQLTSYAKTGTLSENVGYQYRRLKEPIITGIFECNSRCKCGPQCGNRVVQNGLQVRLQMFKTERKGWGIRCLDDLDAGQFICIYAGQLLTDQGADEDGNQFGDEYLAELDHIEVAEKTKEGYESDVPETDNMEVEDKNDKRSEYSDDDPNDPDASFSSDDIDSDFEPSLRSSAITSLSTRRSKKPKLSASVNSNENSENEKSAKKTRRRGLPNISNSLDSNGKTVAKKSINCNSKQTFKKKNKKKKKNEVVKFKPIRSFFGEESCYIMDAKSRGNIGRYLNHSCSPNVFVQNVFVDSHDLRFPAIAFFANYIIPAGTELTWDYNYEVGSVVDKVMYCYCDSRTCRGRLL